MAEYVPERLVYVFPEFYTRDADLYRMPTPWPAAPAEGDVTDGRADQHYS